MIYLCASLSPTIPVSIKKIILHNNHFSAIKNKKKQASLSFSRCVYESLSPSKLQQQASLLKVTWPGFMANKLIGKMLGNSNFVADFNYPMEPFEQSSSSKQSSPNIPKSAIQRDPYKLYVSSWNVGGIAPPEHSDMDDWLDTGKHMADIYVIGFQEIVPLKAGNILGPENKRISSHWNSLIRESLNKTTIKQKGKFEEFREVYFMKNHNIVTHNDTRDFQCVISKQMVGLFITVWVRSDIRPYIQHLSVSCVGSGIMGCLGNKGSVSIRFILHETSFCFVCSHLASGGKQGDENHRNADVKAILTRTSFPQGPFCILPRKILDHDRVIWLGDLNYRISLPEGVTRFLVERKQWDILLKSDQLKIEFTKGCVFEGWHEEDIEFAPTYKYHLNSDNYYGTNRRREGKKLRTPAWCDRIIWFGNGLKQTKYGRGEYRLSDHRQIHAIFIADINTQHRQISSTDDEESIHKFSYNLATV